MNTRHDRGGGILIVVLWTLVLLAALAVATAAYVGARVEVARRLGDKAFARQAARGGVDHGLAMLLLETNAWETLGEGWANSPGEFRDVDGGGRMRWTASYSVEAADGSVTTNYGLSDEQARIDVNLARMEVLAALFRIAGGLPEKSADTLSRTVAEARTPEPPDTRTGGSGHKLWIDRELKNGPFQSVGELLWLQGMTREVFERIEPLVTVQGGARVNINTAGQGVLRILSAVRSGKVNEGWVRKVLQFRAEGGIFKKLSAGGLVEGFGKRAALSADEQAIFSELMPFVTVSSDRFRGHVSAGKGTGAGLVNVVFVWDRRERRFLYWHED